MVTIGVQIPASAFLSRRHQTRSVASDVAMSDERLLLSTPTSGHDGFQPTTTYLHACPDSSSERRRQSTTCGAPSGTSRVGPRRSSSRSSSSSPDSRFRSSRWCGWHESSGTDPVRVGRVTAGERRFPSLPSGTVRSPPPSSFSFVSNPSQIELSIRPGRDSPLGRPCSPRRFASEDSRLDDRSLAFRNIILR